MAPPARSGNKARSCNAKRDESAISFAELARLDYIGIAAAKQRLRCATRPDLRDQGALPARGGRPA
ncbi:hypothetical protein BN2476_80144 [Paraburkholderia piptadeniae]|uniref:Uncharacterized protein n=1 Tax=Paraburkholderia piptadeniae TaxID=1701573 RepID=A0A1N7RMD6_9BURK|nr:hypothetical protein BN2476_80144 [Paraburkholderia piptadeniae]